LNVRGRHLIILARQRVPSALLRAGLLDALVGKIAEGDGI
jgi:hypothetical protein